MDIEVLTPLRGAKWEIWREFLARAELEADDAVEQTVLVWDDDALIATGSRQGNLLKCLAVDEQRKGEGLLAKVLTPLRQEAFRQGYRHLFLYTKPANETLFSSLLFYPVARTKQVLLMEDEKNGIRKFLNSLPVEPCSGTVGAAVMHCDPFTLGHRHLIETAAAECDRVYVFVLSENRGHFPAADRLELVKKGTADLPNVTVLPTGPYLISLATFPTYFLKEREQAGQIQCLLDIEIFTNNFAPRFSITRRYVGTEPFSPMTKQYNDALRTCLPGRGIELREVPRLEKDGVPVSASAVRRALDTGNVAAADAFVPQTTLEYLLEKRKKDRTC